MTVATPDLTGTWDIDPAHSRLGFAARHAMVATVHGSFQVFSGVLHLDHTNPEKSTAEVEIDATSISTGHEQRDAHLRSPDFLDVEKYPKLVFSSTGAERGDARDVVALGPVRLSAAEDDFLDFIRIETRHLAEHVLDGVGGEVVRTGHIEAAAVRLRERRARAGDDDRFSHGGGSFLGGDRGRV